MTRPKEKEFHVPNYSSVCCNRINRSHGGVIIYLHNHLTYKILCKATDDMCSLLAIYVNELKLIILLAYRPPPDYDHGNQFNGPHLENSFSRIIIENINSILLNSEAPMPDVILAGDFNFPNAKWCEGIGLRPQGHSPESRMLCQLINTCDTHNLLQQINFGTRNTPTGGSNTLDLIFTNNHQLITNTTHYKSSISDHDITSCIKLTSEQDLPQQVVQTPLSSSSQTTTNSSLIQPITNPLSRITK